MLHITFAVGFPLSVLVSIIGPGQLKAGGSISRSRSRPVAEVFGRVFVLTEIFIKGGY